MEASWASKTEPRRSKIDVEMASKFDHFLKASWNAIFRPKRRQDAKMPQIAAEDGVGPGPVGEDLGGGKPDVQAPRTFESRTGSKKISGRFEEDLVASSSTPFPVGRRIEAPLGGVPPPNVFGVRRVAIRKGVWKNKAWRFEFS